MGGEGGALQLIAIGSGKGVVGKSTITLNLAIALAERGLKVALVDADIYGPSFPLMVNLTRKADATSLVLAHREGDEPQRWDPVDRFGIKIMSTGFLIGEDQALWNAGLIAVLSSQLIDRVDWGDLDIMLADLPPGSSDVNQTFITSMPFTGAVVVVTPQDVAHLDARKAITMYEQSGVRILGGIENMSALRCPHCDGHVDVFDRVVDDGSIWSMGVTKLGQIPLDPEISRGANKGMPLMVSDPASPQADAFRGIADQITLAIA